MNKKGFTEIAAILLLLIVVVLASGAMYTWFNQFKSDWQAKQEIQNPNSRIEILGIKTYDTTQSQIGLKDLAGKSYHIITKILIDGNECEMISSNVVEYHNTIHLNCSLNLNQNYQIDVFSQNGIFSKTFTVQE